MFIILGLKIKLTNISKNLTLKHLSNYQNL